ncbi:chemotaxis protein CheB [Pseudomonas extremaustralis]|jgi:two-component system, chemotaxis family, protein-glutamate methylesterase/glutaminase|uniref:protein-glutamate methylesterase n=1 Tax=Pseudomonas extremaustralis TaxID=359110 RepID=A0A5C5QQ56_9PSED|nr:chemotaxis protein CheB [Pseudomonas extremaustralis]EZI30027.1 chemotaxis protein CheB [Pseudomonas extremaustralis 14-3 substr. 14-3b]MDB1111507.1 chemotaxis protein CheB [Pseudomonas extremaustralis]MDF3136567.1 chemotaxis protein CheB [Pseudomonas extremaustralis]MDG2965684.1 chemotaxis protein CheB [Pseudomonas extremaustralis]MDY7066648.1 Protein-glutamate methylesterase/protein-glutamine glutaminase [Pseudomonas extremaustralis]
MNQAAGNPASIPGIEAIVIGASAGGVEALLTIFAALPDGFGLPILAVLHLPDERRSQLAEVFGRRLSMPVVEARDKEVIMPGTLYFAGPRYHLSVEQDRSLSLSQEERVHHSRPAIDYLFASAADAYGKGLLAVLLTGANQDGAQGLAQVKAQGGTTVVQDPAEARVAVMPRAALALHTPDHILTLGRIGSLLASLEYSPC